MLGRQYAASVKLCQAAEGAPRSNSMQCLSSDCTVKRLTGRNNRAARAARCRTGSMTVPEQ